MTTKTFITENEYEKFIAEVVDEMLKPSDYRYAWFDGSMEAFENWAGDIFYDAIEIVFEKLGYKIVDDE